jgi:hypothetical protein
VGVAGRGLMKKRSAGSEKYFSLLENRGKHPPKTGLFEALKNFFQTIFQKVCTHKTRGLYRKSCPKIRLF